MPGSSNLWLAVLYALGSLALLLAAIPAALRREWIASGAEHLAGELASSEAGLLADLVLPARLHVHMLEPLGPR